MPVSAVYIYIWMQLAKKPASISCFFFVFFTLFYYPSNEGLKIGFHKLMGGFTVAVSISLYNVSGSKES